MWRPSWNKEELVTKAMARIVSSEPTFRELVDFLFEAGADAMLEALKEDGVFTYGHHTPDIYLEDAPEVSGHWVFIPDEV